MDSFQGYKMDDLLTSYISLMLTSMNKQKSVKKWDRQREKPNVDAFQRQIYAIRTADILSRGTCDKLCFIHQRFALPFIHDNPVQNPFLLYPSCLLKHGRHIPVSWLDWLWNFNYMTLWNQVILMVVGTSSHDLLC